MGGRQGRQHIHSLHTYNTATTKYTYTYKRNGGLGWEVRNAVQRSEHRNGLVLTVGFFPWIMSVIWVNASGKRGGAESRCLHSLCICFFFCIRTPRKKSRSERPWAWLWGWFNMVWHVVSWQSKRCVKKEGGERERRLTRCLGPTSRFLDNVAGATHLY